MILHTITKMIHLTATYARKENVSALFTTLFSDILYLIYVILSCLFLGCTSFQNSISVQRMMASSRVRLWKYQKQVLEDLRADDVIIYLRQDDIINEAEWEILQHDVTTKGRAEKLLQLLFQKMQGDCGGFVYTSFR